MFNSIILAYRDRPKSLKAFLRSLELASKHDNDFELIITDLNSNYRSTAIIEKFAKKFTIKHIKIPYDGVFWKTKALNCCALHATGDYITMFDVECILPKNFFGHIRGFFETPGNERKRLSYRVRKLDKTTSKFFMSNTKFTERDVEKKCTSRGKSFRRFKERAGDENMDAMKMTNADRKSAIKNERYLGNSHFTMTREQYLELGGYDERFIGYGIEDLDFNRRSLAHIGSSTLSFDLKHSIFHVNNNGLSSWRNTAKRKQNGLLYRVNEKKEVVCISRNHHWGIFKESLLKR